MGWEACAGAIKGQVGVLVMKVLYVSSGIGHTNLHMKYNCTETNVYTCAHTHTYPQSQMSAGKTGEIRIRPMDCINVNFLVVILCCGLLLGEN